MSSATLRWRDRLIRAFRPPARTRAWPLPGGVEGWRAEVEAHGGAEALALFDRVG